MEEKPDNPQNKAMEDKKRAFKKLLESVTPKDFFRFLDARNVTTKCQACGKEGLQVTATSGKTNLGELLAGKEGIEFVTYFRLDTGHPGDSDQNYYYKSFCEYCGFITMHAVSPILQWLQSEEDEGENEDEQL
ncbi:hypothetical protein NUKP32_31810 [Klebsiella variicola]|uniref:hypothetical protein n=1 Tax=Klebsiella variicola TaxID=244366 RepID=UPI002181C2CA|nr:hypothetical protein [Klebsiella variicola]GKJ53229.1 hypothetical protein NUKP32_31810 [Klebsiella variicola]